MKVLVADGDNRAALAVTRALGRRGHKVLVGERHKPSLTQASRYCSKSFVYPDPVSNDGAFVDRLSEIVTAEGVQALLPVSDITTNLVVNNRQRFEPACCVPFADAGTIARACDKVDMMRTADRIGVPTPRTWYLCGPGQLIPADVPYPLVLKPHRSRIRTPEGWISCSVSYARDREELDGSLRTRHPAEFPLMLQERVSGPGIGVFVCYDRGELVAIFGHRRIREKPPWGGVSVLCESTAVATDARQCAERLLGELNWHGVAMVEFKRDLTDGLPKLMEINARFWGSLQLAIDSGVDFPNILLGTCGGPSGPHRLPDYRVGVRSRWLWGDLDSLFLRLRSGHGEWPAHDGVGRIVALMQFLQLTGKELHYDNPRRDDPRPWLYETRRRLWPWQS
jgi:predicted ATP-grasp superfamily ATP-dependent carboligase